MMMRNQRKTEKVKNYVFMRLLLVWKLKSCVTVNIQFVSFYDEDKKSKKN
jgi:hypothetical protein